MKKGKPISAWVPGWLAEAVERAASLQGYTVSQFVMKTLAYQVREVLGQEYLRAIVKEWREQIKSNKEV